LDGGGPIHRGNVSSRQQRCKIRGGRALAGAAQNFDVDSIALIIKTAETSSEEMILPAFLVLRRIGGGVLHIRLLTFQPYRRRLPGVQ
jgi:hypothetical protein